MRSNIRITHRGVVGGRLRIVARKDLSQCQIKRRGKLAASPISRTRVAPETRGGRPTAISPPISTARISHIKFARLEPDRPGHRDCTSARGLTELRTSHSFIRTVAPRREGTESEVLMQRDPVDAKEIKYTGVIPAQTNEASFDFAFERPMRPNGAVRTVTARSAPQLFLLLRANTNTAPFQFGFALQVGRPRSGSAFGRFRRTTNAEPAMARPLHYMPAKSTEVETFEHVRLQPVGRI